MKYLLFLLALALLFFAHSCKDEPPTKSEPPPEELIYDTTSHNITWFADTLGDYGQELNDIWAADSVNFYAVGSINISPNPNSFWVPIIKWNGSSWENLPNIGRGEPNELGGIATAIYGFGKNDIWVAGATRKSGPIILRDSGYAFSHFNGTVWKTYGAPTPPWNRFGIGINIYDMWGSDPNHLWAVGDSGLVYFWNGSVWTKQPVPQEVQTMQLFSIFGFSANEVYVTGFGHFYANTVLMRYDGTQWSVIDRVAPYTYPYDFFGVIFGGKWKMGRDEEERFWVVRSGRVECWNRKVFPQQITLQTHLEPAFGSSRVISSSGSNIILTGRQGKIAHWNGVSWHIFSNAFTTLPADVGFHSVVIKGKTIIGIGRSYQGIDIPYYFVGRQE